MSASESFPMEWTRLSELPGRQNYQRSTARRPQAQGSDALNGCRMRLAERSAQRSNVTAAHHRNHPRCILLHTSRACDIYIFASGKPRRCLTGLIPLIPSPSAHFESISVLVLRTCTLNSALRCRSRTLQDSTTRTCKPCRA